MSGPVVVSGRTAAQLEEVARFFGIDLEWNRHIFRYAVQVDGRAFEVVIGALAQAVELDSRRGVTGRIRESVAKGKTKKWLSGKSCGNRANGQHPKNGFSCGK